MKYRHPGRPDMVDEVRQAAQRHHPRAGSDVDAELGHSRNDRLAALVVLGVVLAGLIAVFFLIG